MELKATSLGKHLAQHPYNRVRLLNAGVEVSGDKHHYLIPFNQLITIQCKRGIVWGELEFELPEGKVVRLHGTEWQETQRFYHHLSVRWQAWSEEMAAISAQVLAQQQAVIEQAEQQPHWLTQHELATLQQGICEAFDALPMPVSRMAEFASCRAACDLCLRWLEEGAAQCEARNRAWAQRMMADHASFFASVEQGPLNARQMQAVVNGEETIQVRGGAGSGKTSLVVARAGWLLQRGEAGPQQILLLAPDRQGAEALNRRITARLGKVDVEAMAFQALALQIIRQSGRKVPKISKLEEDGNARRKMLLKVWQQQCETKKPQATGWRALLTDDLGWEIPDKAFWKNRALGERLAPRLDQWLGLMRRHGGTQAEMLSGAPDALQSAFQKQMRLLAPLLKAWKAALKEEGAVDSAALRLQAMDVLNKGRFISPWKQILVDDIQAISLGDAQLLAALRAQNSRTGLFATVESRLVYGGSDDVEQPLPLLFSDPHARCELETTYRLDERMADVADGLIRQPSGQGHGVLASLRRGDKKSIQLLPDDQLDALLDKLSGFVDDQQQVLLLARHATLRPASLQKAATRWPKLHITFSTVHDSKGQQAEFVIVLGLQAGRDGFPAPAGETVAEQVLQHAESALTKAQERGLLYVALTRASERVWVLYSPGNPSCFVDELKKRGVPVQRKP
ncbi:DNA helicase IV [Chimaeribacter californicus]|uniref:DNA 3'-5' helicase n=1 Tax=Chimaeribacter californicus TaxID=2060067 RepID=A0A2N5EFQ2_9GAMM|nr:DNA helicase IV [Chimaeribacter californicus]PLR41368.1 DNA helicase IV [Chimaeribacter californicus]